MARSSLLTCSPGSGAGAALLCFLDRGSSTKTLRKQGLVNYGLEEFFIAVNLPAPSEDLLPPPTLPDPPRPDPPLEATELCARQYAMCSGGR